ncbi:MAG: protein BatD [FCB group bacterium]|nr:protein BatD [FCB group bacterium]
MTCILPVVLALILLTAGNAAAQDEISIVLSLDRHRIGLDEQAILTVKVSAGNQQNLPEAKLPPMPRFDIYSAGSSTSLQIINGETSYSTTTNYILSPKKTGTYPIRSAWLVISGTRFESNQLSITVLSPEEKTAGQETGQGLDGEGKSRDLFMTAEIDKKSAYVDEQVTLSVKFFRGVQLMSSIDFTPPPTSGFWTSNIPPQKRYYETINGRDYNVYEIRTALFPTQPGKLTIGESQITAKVPDRSRRRNRDPFSFFDDMFQSGKRVRVTSKPISIDVKPLPTQGKTDDFSGGVGSYSITAGVDKTEMEVNEAVTLTVKISGKGNVKSIPEPTLPRLDDFRVEKSSSDFNQTNLDDDIGGSKTFEYVLIPRLPGQQTIKPLTLNYFDPVRKSYLTTQTEPIVLHVNQGELTAGAEVPYNPVSGQTINLKETDIRFIKTDNGHLAPKGKILLTSPVFMTVLAFPLVVLLGGMVDVRRRRRLKGDVAYARLRRANAMAKKRLQKAESIMNDADKRPFYTEVSNVILEYIADKYNLSAAGLTSDRVEEILGQHEVNDGTRQEILEIIELADFGRFAGSAQPESDGQQLYNRVRKAMVDLEGAL